MLEGIRILDLTRYFPGPFATLRLEERGAEVIKIEDTKGDPARYMDRYDGQEGTIFRCMSRGKRCVSLDLKAPHDKEKFIALVKTADALVESFRPGVAQRLGIDFDTLRQINPKLVYVSLTGYGQNTSYAHLAGHDLNYMAMSGLLDQLLDSGGVPIKPQIALADLISGYAASEAIAMGLIKSLRTGEGSYIDVSMTDAVLSLMGLHVMNQSATGEEHGINEHGIGYGIFRTSDNRYIALCALEEKFFINFCKAIDREDLIPLQHTKPSSDNPAYREIENIIAQKSLEEWARFSEAVDCCMAPVLHTSELKDSKYVKERKMIMHKWDLDYVASCYTGKESFLNFDAPYSKLGEDNDLVFQN